MVETPLLVVYRTTSQQRPKVHGGYVKAPSQPQRSRAMPQSPMPDGLGPRMLGHMHWSGGECVKSENFLEPQ